MDDIVKDPFFEDYQVFWSNSIAHGHDHSAAFSTRTLVLTSQESINNLPSAFTKIAKSDSWSVFGPLCEEYVRDVTAKVASNVPHDLAFLYAATLYLELDFWTKCSKGDEQTVIDDIQKVIREQKNKRVASMSSVSKDDRKRLDLSAHEPFITKLLR